MFRFVTRYLGFMKVVPLAPHIFEAALKLQTLVLRPVVLSHIDNICAVLEQWPYITLLPHRYGGVQFNYRQKELGHIHGNGLADILLDKTTANELIQQGKALPHHSFKNSGWVSIYITGKLSADETIALYRIAYDKRSQREHTAYSG